MAKQIEASSAVCDGCHGVRVVDTSLQQGGVTYLRDFFISRFLKLILAPRGGEMPGHSLGCLYSLGLSLACRKIQR